MVNPWKVTRILLIIVGGLTIASLAGSLANYLFGFDSGWGLIPAFDLNRERNIPTWYAGSSLFFTSLLLAFIASVTARSTRAYVTHWAGLSIMFMLLSIDEIISIHEQWSDSLRDVLQVSGIFYFAWIIPACIGILAVAIAYRKFLAHLPGSTCNRIMAAALLYLGGAVGLEIVGGQYYSAVGGKDLIYSLMTTVEELLEMLGVVVFIHALLSYLAAQGIRIDVTRTPKIDSA